KPKLQEVSQRSPIGVVLLLKTALDSNNVYAAVQVLASPTGTHYSGDEKVDLLDDLTRFGRLVSQKPVTGYAKDSLTENNYEIYLQLDYYKVFSFNTLKIKDRWYVTDYQEEKNNTRIKKFDDIKY
ncbi:MAG: hypothetical protein ABSG15_07695, partial [FCB group bacterium]